MDNAELTEKLRSITERFSGVPTMGILANLSPPFDVSKPNQHDNKQEFFAEMKAVQMGKSNVDGLIELLAAGFREGLVSVEVGKRIAKFVDADARLESRNYTVESGYDLVRRNSSELSLTHCLVYQLMDLRRGLRMRYVELMDQEKEFWSSGSRPPNHYARTISLRLARYIANHTQKKPTIGTSPDGGHPSTDFGRALEEVFELLEIKANVGNAGRWAISQLTDEDVKQRVIALDALYGRGAIRPEERLARLIKKDLDG